MEKETEDNTLKKYILMWLEGLRGPKQLSGPLEPVIRTEVKVGVGIDWKDLHKNSLFCKLMLMKNPLKDTPLQVVM